MLRIARFGRFLYGGAPAATCQMVLDGGGQGWIGCPVDCARALEDRAVPLTRVDPALFQRSRVLSGGVATGGFFFGPRLAPGAPGTYSTGPGLPRAGCLAIWPGAPRASPGPPGPKKKLFWISRRLTQFIILRAEDKIIITRVILQLSL